MIRIVICTLALAASLPAQQPPKQKIYNLPIGDPQLRTRDARILLDSITDASNNETLSTADLPARLRDTRLLLLGEDLEVRGIVEDGPPREHLRRPPHASGR